MKIILKMLILLSVAIPTFDLEARNFGTGADMEKLVPISKILSSPKQYLNEIVTVKGTIVAVCENRGCWLKLASDKEFQTLRIKVKDGDMVFPLNSKDKTAFATGRLKAMELSKEKAISYLQHMADESKEEFDSTSITKGITIYQLVPQGVTIVD
jgi:hypothetical protein